VLFTRQELQRCQQNCSPPGKTHPDQQRRGEGKKRTVNLASLNRIANRLRALAIHLATNAESSAQNLLDATLEVLGEGLEAHRPRNLNHLVESDRAAVLDVLDLLAVTRGLLERPDDEGRRRRDDRHLGLAVLDRELDRHAKTLLLSRKHGEKEFAPPASEQRPSQVDRSPYLSPMEMTYPVTSGLGDIFTDLLRRETERADFGGKSRRGTDLTTGRPEVAVSSRVVSNRIVFAREIVSVCI
jgi:hypothetical protein